ncbi:FitA-like ribbon-helix-helix domain-containing protein [Thiocystis violacea]|uniref:FitA-like ribbon-helix-helix domain-containing protein n=1 Tax=Thiocystis violacea TaxID=13725 RepID=UPI00190318C8|nr:hypothetical protein [Thiocystis violacea]MBK1716890.1 hypothetical protein [Thiocystis violacea]
MPTITLRDVPEPLHQRLQQQARQHHRSIDREVMVLLETLLDGPVTPATPTREERRAAMLRISRRCATAPEQDPRSADEIIGYDANGWPA